MSADPVPEAAVEAAAHALAHFHDGTAEGWRDWDDEGTRAALFAALNTGTLHVVDPKAVEAASGKWTVDPKTGCWNWNGAKSNGYGQRGAPPHRAHRWVYEMFEGPIPEGLELDHLCRNRACVNPEHLEPVTPGINNRRGLKAKLTTTQRRQVREARKPLEEIAEEYGISVDYVREIRRGGHQLTKLQRTILTRLVEGPTGPDGLLSSPLGLTTRDQAHKACHRLVGRGLLSRPTPGLYEITDAGREELERWSDVDARPRTVSIPQDEQGRRELVENLARWLLGRFSLVGGWPDNWSHLNAADKDAFREDAEALLQMVGLLPEQEKANG